MPQDMKSKEAVHTIKAEQRTRLNQTDIPAYTLEKTLAIARAIADNYAFRPASPLDIASALNLIPTTGGFRMLTGASVAYGLTDAGYSASQISLTPLALRIVRPLSEDGDDDRARREAVLMPRIVGEFLKKYDGSALPKMDIMQNVLHTMGVPADRTKDAASMIVDNAKAVGLLRHINERMFVDLKGLSRADSPLRVPDVEDVDQMQTTIESTTKTLQNENAANQSDSRSDTAKLRAKKVFITHGKNRALIDPIEKLLKFGDLDAFVSVHSQTVSQPVPTKVMEEMRSCGAAIIHVENERSADYEGKEQAVINSNVLIEIGAAMALFGSRFILVVKDGVELPSNLQGLLVLRYKGDTLDVNDTVQLLDAIADMKSRSLPS